MASETHVNDGSAFRKITRAYINDGVGWRFAKEIWINDGVAWRKVFVGFTPGFSGGLGMSNTEESWQGNDPTEYVQAMVAIQHDGSISETSESFVNNSYSYGYATTPPTWGLPLTSGIGTNYWVKLNYGSGTVPSGYTLGEWHNLAYGPYWYLRTYGVGGAEFYGTIYLSNNGQDSGIISSTSFGLGVEIWYA